jgi:hypothetical protein
VGGDSTPPLPELVVDLAIDPEGDPLTYGFQVDVNDRFDSPALQSVEGILPEVSDARWVVPESLTENQVYFWRGQATDGQAVGEWSETATFRVNEVNEPPSVPTLQNPTGGTLVKSLTPVLTLINSTDPEENTLTYGFEVYADADLNDMVASVEALREGEEQTAWVVSPRLEEDGTYYWRANASDHELASAWPLPEPFRVNVMNREPTAPVLDSPADGSRVSAPVLSVFNATDADGDPLVYRFELYEDELLTTLLDWDDVDEQTDRTAWEPTATLVENEIYYWRARASDGELDGPWMATARFLFSSVNEPPGAPTPLLPEDGAEVVEATPVLQVENTTDPDGDPLRYIFEVFSDPGLTTLVVRSDPVEEGAGETSWRVSVPLEENGTFFWQAVAADDLLEGPPSETFSFSVNSIHDPPTVPAPSSPANGSDVDSTSVELVVQNATSPDGYALHYHFAIYRDAELNDLVAEDTHVLEGDPTTVWGVPLELTPGQTYFWRARAIDDEDVAGDWSATWQFTVVTTTPECPPEWGDDFESYPRGSPPDNWELTEENGHPRYRI